MHTDTGSTIAAEESTTGRLDPAQRHVLAAIGVARIVWGVATALGSAPVHRVGGIAYPGPDGGMWIKAFGVRDIVLGVAALHPEETIRRATLRAGIAMDLVDAGVVIFAARRGLPRRAARIGVAMAGGAALFAAAGPSLLRRMERTRGRG